MLQPEFCRSRQRRVLDLMQRWRLDAVVLGDPRNVYYLSGHRNFWLHESALVLFCDGRSLLVAANTAPDGVAADEVVTFEASWLGTQRQEQAIVVAEVVEERCSKLKSLGADASHVGAWLEMDLGESVLIEPELWQLRRRKDPDELALMKRAIACTRAMYDRARQVIEPGVPELRVYAELHAAAVEAAGEPLSPAHLGNDFQCGSPGGPPRQGRNAGAGELYILDLGPAHCGYFSDNSRVFAVDRQPTDAQLKAWTMILGVFPIVEGMAKPGIRCRDLFAAIDDYYRTRTGQGFPHHLGHGVGLQPHEYPHLNPKWDDTLQEGEVFTCEPGLYAPELAAGLRIENQYLVTADGLQNLTPFPTDLA
jgi:Xaa-Pro aminopeptidase